MCCIYRSKPKLHALYIVIYITKFCMHVVKIAHSILQQMVLSIIIVVVVVIVAAVVASAIVVVVVIIVWDADVVG